MMLFYLAGLAQSSWPDAHEVDRARTEPYRNLCRVTGEAYVRSHVAGGVQ